jgi:signal transduction histidine kinase
MVLVTAGIAVVGWLFVSRATMFMEDALRTYLQTSAMLAAQQFDPEDLDIVRSPLDRNRPEYTNVVHRLDAIRDGIASARFAYIFRRTNNPGALAFVADADGLAMPEELDMNGNGIVDPDEEPGLPGDLYDITSDPMLQGAAFLAPIAGEFYVDQWGELISGYAPIRDASGNTVAVIGIDMRANEFRRLARSIVSPVVATAGLAVMLLLAVYIGVILWARQLQGLRKLAAERSALIDLAMHQIGAPLAAFRWWTDLMEEQEKEKSITRMEGYHQLHDSIARMDGVITAMRTASSVQHGDMTYHSESADLYAVIEGVVASARAKPTQAHRQIDVILEPNLRCRFDPRLITGVLEELLENALTYADPKGSITIRAVAKRRRIEVSVSDQGDGIPPEDRTKLFQPFTRGKEAYRRKPVGNGLGLYVAKHIVEAGGGNIDVESSRGKGTTVRFTLPRA